MLKAFIKASLFLIPQSILAQGFTPMDIPFMEFGEPDVRSLAGGLNSPQFSKVDLNNDGIEDLYIFDRANNVHLPFLISEENGALVYTYDYDYVQNFPKCKNWVALRDYNGDDIADLFTYEAASQVYRGRYENGKIAFDLVTMNHGDYLNKLSYYKTPDSLDFISLFPDDYPTIEDVDGDGDLDILAFGGKPSVSYFQNMAIEYGYPLDSLTYILADDCWGRFARDVNNEVLISPNINECASGFSDAIDERMHLTLTLMVYDEDDDGDMDAMVGSATSVDFTKLINNGPAGTAFMTEVYPTYPDYDIPVNINAYPTAFYLDVDNDGISEFIASPNQVENGEDQESVWLYENVGTGNETIWEQQQTDWLVDGMIDLGSNSAPAFVDYNADGLMDLVVGTGGLWLWTNKGSLALYENTGTATEPSFTLIDDDWLEFSEFNDMYTNFTPTFGDLDNDGDLDLLAGSDSGELIYVENEAGAGNPVQFNDIVFGWNDLLVGRKTVPQIADLNRDGLMDLLIGERAGNINFIPNIGTVGNPQFSAIHELPPNNEFFGEINTSGTAVLGNATPCLLDRGTHFLLIVGSGSVGLKFYEFTENDLDGIINSSNDDWGKLRMGDNLYPALFDLNGDDFLELMLGSRRGGLTVFGSNLGVNPLLEEFNFVNLTVFPNPVVQILEVNTDLLPSSKNLSYSIYNNLGQLVKTATEPTIPVNDLPNGVYFLEAKDANYKTATKFIKMVE